MGAVCHGEGAGPRLRGSVRRVVARLGVQSPAQRRGGKHVVAVVDLERGVVDAEPLAEHLLDRQPALVAVDPGVDQDVAERAGKPEVTSQTWSSWTSVTPSTARIPASTAPGSIPRGDASRKIRALSRSRRYAASAIRAATTSVATASAWVQPVSVDDEAGHERGDEGDQVGDDVPEAPAMLRLRRSARASSAAAAEVDQDPDGGDQGDRPAVDVGRMDAADVRPRP